MNAMNHHARAILAMRDADVAKLHAIILGLCDDLDTAQSELASMSARNDENVNQCDQYIERIGELERELAEARRDMWTQDQVDGLQQELESEMDDLIAEHESELESIRNPRRPLPEGWRPRPFSKVYPAECYGSFFAKWCHDRRVRA